MKVYFQHNIPPTCFGHSCGQPQGGALQRMDTSRCNEFLNQCTDVTYCFKNTWFKIYIKVQNIYKDL